MARRKIKKIYPGRDGFRIRLTPCTPSEKRRRRHSINLRIGDDLVEWVRDTASRHNLTQGELARSLLLDARDRLESGEIDLPQSGWYRGKSGQLDASDPLGRLVSASPPGDGGHD